jgi:general bacterial porin, GBP family
MKKTLILTAVSATFASAAYAQSSVTLYGVIDAGFTYVQNDAKTNGDGRIDHGDAYHMGHARRGRSGSRHESDLHARKRL